MSKQYLKRRARTVLAAAALAGAVLASVPTQTLAVDYTWTGATSTFWRVSSNWNPVGVPGGSITIDSASIPSVSNFGPTNVTFDLKAQPTSLTRLLVSRTGIGPYFSILDMPANSLSAVGEEVGYGVGIVTARGEINQSGGTNTMEDLELGGTLHDIGIYNLSGTGQLNIGGQADLGFSGSGSINQSGGTVNLDPGATLNLGYNGGSTNGHYTLDGNGTIAGGQLIVGYNGAGTFDQSAGVASLSQVTLGGNAIGAGTCLLSGTGALTSNLEVIGKGRFGTFNQTGGTNTAGSILIATAPASSGTYNLSGGALSAGSIAVNLNATINFTGGSFTTASLTLSGGGKMFMGSGDRLLLKTNSLSIAAAAGSKLDLANNAAIVDYSGASPIATIANYVKTGYAGGAWTGNGITSSSAAADSTTALGYADNSALRLSSFMGQSVDSTSVLIRYTYAGDVNLDGRVDMTDFNLLAASFGQTGKDWVNGDFNHSGTVDTIDFDRLARNFGRVLPGGAGAIGSSLGATVPEPGGCGLLVASLTPLMKRRRIRNRRPTNAAASGRVH